MAYGNPPGVSHRAIASPGSNVAGSTDRIEMRAGPGDLVETLMKPTTDPKAAAFLLKHDFDETSH